MFSRTKPNLVCSDEGFCVEVLGRTGVRYHEGEASIYVDGELLAGPHGFLIYKDSMRLDAGPAPGIIDEGERIRIVANIQKAFAFVGFDIEII